MTSAVGIYFHSLKDCLMFLQWLYVGLRGEKLRAVVKKLHEVLHPYYKDVDIDKIYTDLYNFLSKVDSFYGKLALKKLIYVNRSNSNPPPQDIVDALLVCIPRFFSAIYYMWYDVNNHFEKLGGGLWMYNYPGYDGQDLLGRYWGGGLQQYLTNTSKNESHNNTELLLGGFEKGEIKYGYNDSSGFYQGRSMIEDLRQLLDKDSTKSNLFRDIFCTTVFPTNAGAYISNIANVLALVGTFCNIVETERSVIDLEKHEGLKKSFIHWTELVDHCKLLKHPLDKIFKPGAFSFTGYRRDITDLKIVGFARRTAAWLRGNLDSVKKTLDTIVPYAGKNYLKIFDTNERHHKIKDYRDALGYYVYENVFPYGFTFYGDNIYTLPNNPHSTLSNDWNPAIEMLKGKNGLEKLKKLLEGLEYPEGHELDKQAQGASTHDDSKKHVVTHTEDPNHVTDNIEEGVNHDNNSDSGHINGTAEDIDGLKPQQGDPIYPQVTSDSSNSSDEGPNGSEILENNEQTADKRGDDHNPLCDHAVPDMNSLDHEECFLHKTHHQSLITG